MLDDRALLISVKAGKARVKELFLIVLAWDLAISLLPPSHTQTY